MNYTQNQIKKRAETILNWLEKKPFFPTDISLSMTNKCNLSCKFCHFGAEKERQKLHKELSEKDFVALVEEALNLGIKYWYIDGGEPLYYPEKFLKVIETIKKHNTYGNFNTNGTLFNDKLIKKIIELGWDEITFSIDSADPKIHDELRGVYGTYKKATTAIKKLQKWKKLLDKDKPSINIHTIITDKNYNQLDKIIELGNKLNVANINFTHLFRETKFYNLYKLEEKHHKEFRSNARKAYELSLKYKIGTNVGEYVLDRFEDNEEKKSKLKRTKNLEKSILSVLSVNCFEPWYKLKILSFGVVSCCCRNCENDTGPDNVIAINEEGFPYRRKLKEIWKGKRLENVRKEIFRNNLPETCFNCSSSAVLYNRNIREYLKKVLEKNG